MGEPVRSASGQGQQRAMDRGGRMPGGMGGGAGGIGNFQQFGAVPVTPRNLYRLMENGEFALLFPGGVREANHGKGEDYQLFWPKRTDFVRMAAQVPQFPLAWIQTRRTATKPFMFFSLLFLSFQFDAIIVPFGAIGAADSVEILADGKELAKLPVIGDSVRSSAAAVPAARRGNWRREEEEEEDFTFPLVRASLPPLVLALELKYWLSVLHTQSLILPCPAGA